MMMQENEYSNKMVEAFVAKPDKTVWYENAFEKFDNAGKDKITWQWSWWAFGGGFLYLLYRKTYIPSLVLFIVSIFIGFIPFGGLLLAILAGGFAPYFVYKDYKTKKENIEAVVPDEDNRVKAMEKVGGYHQWVVWVYIAFIVLIAVYIVSIISVLASVQQ